MSRITVGMLLAFIATTFITIRAAEVGPPEVIVRTYKLSVSQQEVTAARRVVAKILGKGGIGATWLQCWSAAASALPSACGRPLRAGEVILKIVPTGDANSVYHQASLGYSYVDSKDRRGSVATVYSDRVKELARSSGVSTGELLGRAIAHEIGHLLLGTNQHAAVGLMRAVWSGAEVRRSADTFWSFSKEEVRTIRQTIGGPRADRSEGW